MSERKESANEKKLRKVLKQEAASKPIKGGLSRILKPTGNRGGSGGKGGKK